MEKTETLLKIRRTLELAFEDLTKKIFPLMENADQQMSRNICNDIDLMFYNIRELKNLEDEIAAEEDI